MISNKGYRRPMSVIGVARVKSGRNEDAVIKEGNKSQSKRGGR